MVIRAVDTLSQKPNSAKDSSHDCPEPQTTTTGPWREGGRRTDTGRDSNPVRHIGLGAVRVAGGEAARAGPATDPHRDTWL